MLARIALRHPVNQQLAVTPHMAWLHNRTDINGYEEKGGAGAGRVTAPNSDEVGQSVSLRQAVSSSKRQLFAPNAIAARAWERHCFMRLKMPSPTPDGKRSRSRSMVLWSKADGSKG